MNLHPGQSLAVSVSGAPNGFTAALDNPIATLQTNPQLQTLTVTALQQTGRATLTLTSASGATLAIPVRVADDAAVIAPDVSLSVTGTDIDPQWLQAQVEKAILRASTVQPGVVPQFGAFSLPQLTDGTSASLPVPVQVAGGQNYFDVSTTTDVDVTHVDATPFAPMVLLYDDDPEKLIADGVLYRNQVAPQTPVRLYYYHQDSAQARRLLLVLSSLSPGDASTVQLIDASAGPSEDVMSVGHAVSRDALQQEPHNEGTLAQVAYGAPYVADAFTLAPLQGAAGSVGIRVLSGAAVQVTVLAVPPGAGEADVLADLSQPPLPGDGHHRTGSFDISAYGTEIVAYDVGGPDAQVQYGATTPPPIDGAGHDYGDYGVFRRIAFQIENPTAQPAVVYLYEEPLGGVVRSSFLVDGTLEQVGCARLDQHYAVGPPLSAPPGASQVTVVTMTDGGSNYPLAVGLSAAAPLPIPPISGPTGCFPKPQAAVPAPAASPPAPEPTG